MISSRPTPGDASAGHFLPAARMQRRLLAVLALAIVGLTMAALVYEYREELQHQGEQLEAVSDLRARQVGSWLDERLARARFARGSAVWANWYTRWRENDDLGARDQLLERAVAMRKAFGDRSVAFTDERGDIVLSEGGSTESASPGMRAAALRALATGEVQHSGLNAGAGNAGLTGIDVVAPLVAGKGTARAAVVFHNDPQDTLLPILAAWPVPSRTAVTLLIRREGDGLVGVKGRSIPVTTPSLFAAKVFRGELPFGHLGDGIDNLGVPVYGIVRPVPGTDWYLVAKIDRREVLDNAMQDAVWIAAAGALALLGTAIGAFLLRERGALGLARAGQAEQGERIRSLALVQAIADGSTDAIFAKDPAGRYLLANREAVRLTGRPLEGILGQDDRALFPADQASRIMASDAQVLADRRITTYEEQLSTSDGPFTFLTTKGALLDATGRGVGTFGISRNITERKRNELALQESELRYRALLESMTDGMFVALDHRFVFANPALPKMLGYGQPEFVDLPFEAVVAPEFLAVWNARYEQRVGDGTEPMGHYEVQFLCRGGQERVWIELRASRHSYRGRPAVLGMVRDVSARRQNEAALRNMVELFQGVRDSVPNHMAVLDRHGVITDTNLAWTRFAETNAAGDGMASAGTGVGTDYLAVCRASGAAGCDEAKDAGAGIAAVLAGERELFTLEYPCHSPSALRWFQMVVTPLRTAAGGAVVVHSDITERRRADDALRTSEQRFRKLFDEAPLPMALVGKDGKMLDLNGRFLQVFGYGREEVTSIDAWHEKAHPDADYRARVEATWNAAVAEASAHRTDIAPAEFRVTCRDGSERTMVTSGIVLAEGYLATFFDVTERQRAEEALRQSQQVALAARASAEAANVTLRQLSLAVEQSPDSIVITDLNAQIAYVNEAFLRNSVPTIESPKPALERAL